MWDAKKFGPLLPDEALPYFDLAFTGALGALGAFSFAALVGFSTFSALSFLPNMGLLLGFQTLVL